MKAIAVHCSFETISTFFAGINTTESLCSDYSLVAAKEEEEEGNEENKTA